MSSTADSANFRSAFPMRLFLLIIALALVALGLWSLTRHGRGASPAAAAVARVPEVPIQDRKTIDFSSGKPVVKDSAAEKAAIDRAVRDMDTAAAGVTFSPTPTASPSTRK